MPWIILRISQLINEVYVFFIRLDDLSDPSSRLGVSPTCLEGLRRASGSGQPTRVRRCKEVLCHGKGNIRGWRAREIGGDVIEVRCSVGLSAY